MPHLGEPGFNPEIAVAVSPADSIAAVAESAPTTSSFDEPSSPNTIAGKMTV